MWKIAAGLALVGGVVSSWIFDDIVATYFWIVLAVVFHLQHETHVNFTLLEKELSYLRSLRNE